MENAGAESAVDRVAVDDLDATVSPYGGRDGRFHHGGPEGASRRPDGAERGQRRSRAKVKFYSNCWLWAILTCLRRGGFLIVSKSEWGWWPHVMWSPDLRKCHQFEPDHTRLRGRLLPPLIYRGYIKTTRLR